MAFVPELSRALKRRSIDVAGADRMVLLQQLAVADMLGRFGCCAQSDR